MGISTISVPVPTSQFLELAEFLRQQGSDRDPVDAIHTAIGYWIDNASWKQDVLLPEAMKDSRIAEGFWWKTVFLPSGTKVRTIYKGKTYLGEVSPEGINFEGRTYSPSSFMHKVTGTHRNAWRDIELMLPDSKSWFLADNLRKHTKR